MRALWLPAALPGALALILCFVPLFDVLGYAHSFALGLLCPISAGLIGLRAGRDGLASLGRALRGATLHLALALAIISINALRVRNCNYLTGLTFFALLPLASSLYAAALAVSVAHVGARWAPRIRHAVFAALLAGSFIMSVWSLYKEPPIFAFNHLYGYFAGSIYDEVITIDTPLLAFRLFTLLRVMAIAIGIAVLATKLGPWRRGALVCGLVVTVLGAERLLGERLDFRSSRARILTELSRPLTLPGLVIHLPPHLDENTRAKIGRDHAFRLWQLTRELGVDEQPVIESFIYASPTQKVRLLGAKDTMFTKPWRRELHLDYAPAPHPLLKHELAHVVAASFARPPLRVSSRFGVLVNMALVEGLAEAVSPSRGDFDLDTQARVLEELGLAPDLRQILGARGFWAAAPARAYTVAGSFVRFLINRYGNEKIKAVYASGDFAAVYGKELDALIAEWELMIAALPVAPESLDHGRARFAMPSIFARECGHEMATLRATARRAPPGEAVAIYRRIAELERHSTASKTELALGLLRAQADEELLALSAELLADDELSAADRYRLRQARAELFWQKDEPHLARVELLADPRSGSSTAARRLEWVRLWALEEPLTTGHAVRDFLTRGPSTKSIVALLEAYAKTPKDKTLPYLIGRHLAQNDACKEASRYLEAAAPHQSPLIEAERRRLHASCLLELDELERGRAELVRYLELAKTSGESERARDLLQYAEWLATE